jgi:hypothetical protein
MIHGYESHGKHSLALVAVHRKHSSEGDVCEYRAYDNLPAVGCDFGTK